MKKIIIFILIFTSSLLSLFAWQPLETKALQIQAGVDKALEINVEPIPAQTEFFLIGMPFNIEEDYVKYSAELDGRIIAHWNILSNSQYSIFVDADKLHHVDTSSYPNANLDYILTFTYDIGYIDVNNNSQSMKGEFVYNTANNSLSGSNVEENKFKFTGNIKDSFIGLLDGDIYFMFTDSATNTIAANKENNSATVPQGDYIATVTLTMEALI